MASFNSECFNSFNNKIDYYCDASLEGGPRGAATSYVSVPRGAANSFRETATSSNRLGHVELPTLHYWVYSGATWSWLRLVLAVGGEALYVLKCEESSRDFVSTWKGLAYTLSTSTKIEANRRWMLQLFNQYLRKLLWKCDYVLQQT